MFKHAYGKYSRSSHPFTPGQKEGAEQQEAYTFPASEKPSRTPVYVHSNKGKKKPPSEEYFDVRDNTVKRRRLRVNN
jgi:hypothetical protein